jgi:hypothetical protein
MRFQIGNPTCPGQVVFHRPALGDILGALVFTTLLDACLLKRGSKSGYLDNAVFGSARCARLLFSPPLRAISRKRTPIGW